MKFKYLGFPLAQMLKKIINRGYYTEARRYEFYVLVARTISHENIKFISSS